MVESPADRTAKVSLREATARAHAARATKFVWPSPPYYEFAEAPRPQGEKCLLTFIDGARATGLLQTFLPEFEVLKFLPDNGKGPETVGFSALLGVNLLNPVALRRQSIPGEA